MPPGEIVVSLSKKIQKKCIFLCGFSDIPSGRVHLDVCWIDQSHQASTQWAVANAAYLSVIHLGGGVTEHTGKGRFSNGL